MPPLRNSTPHFLFSYSPSDILILTAQVPSHDVRDGQPLFDGTILLPQANKGNADADAFIHLHENAVCSGFVIFYDQQNQHAAPLQYPYSISMTGANSAVTDVELLNSFNGIHPISM